MDKNEKLLYVVFALVLFVLGCIFVPKIINLISNRVYRKMDKEDIDFDNMGPKIVKKEREEQ